MTHSYLGWEQPFCLSLADRLREFSRSGEGLDSLLVWIPSARAGRHVLNELFTGDPEDTESIHPPQLVTPASFIRSLLVEREGVASELHGIQAWKAALLHTDSSKLKDLFPVVPEINRTHWAYSMAKQLMQLKQAISEECKSFQDIASVVTGAEKDRWQILSYLESAYRQELSRRGLVDGEEFLDENLSRILEIYPFRKVVVAGVLNLSPRQIKCLQALDAQGMEVELFLPVPADRAGQFDEWGRPLADVWNNEPLPDEIIEDRIQRSTEPRELVQSLIELAGSYKEEVDSLVVGSPADDLADYLVERSRLGTTPFYTPVGKPLAQTGLGRLLQHLEGLMTSGHLSGLREMLHDSHFREWILEKDFDPGVLEKDLLKLQQEHFLMTLQAISDPELKPISSAGRIRSLCDYLETTLELACDTIELPNKLWEFLQQITHAGTATREDVSILNLFEEVLLGLKEEMDPEIVTDRDFWELLRFKLETQMFYPEREVEQRPVSGWLELAWETAPHLVILGLPDVEVPGPAGGDTFMTPGLCREAELRTPEEESAFHACRLRIILECRYQWGRVDILLPDRGLDDFPCQPSRFLFQSPEDSVLKRVHLLLDSTVPNEDPLAAEFGAQLNIPDSPEIEKISVTEFRSYLDNPLYYYLERRLRWRAPEALPHEMDALGYGILAHSVMEAFNGTEEGAKLRSEKDIGQFLEDILDAEVRQSFGSQHPVPLHIQVNSLRERLRSAVPSLAANREEGWLPMKVEWAWHEDHPLAISGVQLRGKIDLLEWNEGLGIYRVTDYKTSDKGDSPKATHFKSIRGSITTHVAESVFQIDGKPHRWTDLQLPLYQHAVQSAFSCDCECAYFNFPKTVSNTGFETYRFSSDQQQAALACAEGVIKHIKAGEFPLNKSGGLYDSWPDWFGGDIELNVDPEWSSGPGRSVS